MLLIIVTSEGDVQNRILHADRAYSQPQLTEASNYFNQQFAGQPFATIRERLAADLARLRDDIAQLMTAAVDAGEDATSGGDDVVVAGERNLLTTEDFVSNMSRLRRLFDHLRRAGR